MVTEEAVGQVFHALADATRRDILRRSVRGDSSVSRLATAYPMSFAAVQKHVAVLERAGLVTKERRGREQLVRTDPDAVAAGAAGPRRARDGLARASGPNGRAARAGPRPTSEPTEERAQHMSVTSIEKDFDRLTLVVVADFDATPERVWQLWADPRKLERWWGPPSYPATVQQYDLTPGGDVSYFMTGPEGEKYHGWWRVTSVNPPKSLEFRDGFADQDGNPAPDMPTTTVSMQLIEHGRGTRMELRTVFDTREAMERLDSMGMTEGMREAVGQMDALLVG